MHAVRVGVGVRTTDQKTTIALAGPRSRIALAIKNAEGALIDLAIANERGATVMH